MKLEDLDRILLAEKEIEPSVTFEGNIMSRVQAEAVQNRRIPFPWIPFAAAILILTVLVLRFYPIDSVLRGVDLISSTIVNWVVFPTDVTLRNALLSEFVSLAGTLFLVWFSLRLAGNSR